MVSAGLPPQYLTFRFHSQVMVQLKRLWKPAWASMQGKYSWVRWPVCAQNAPSRVFWVKSIGNSDSDPKLAWCGFACIPNTTVPHCQSLFLLTNFQCIEQSFWSGGVQTWNQKCGIGHKGVFLTSGKLSMHGCRSFDSSDPKTKKKWPGPIFLSRSKNLGAASALGSWPNKHTQKRSGKYDAYRYDPHLPGTKAGTPATCTNRHPHWGLSISVLICDDWPSLICYSGKITLNEILIMSNSNWHRKEPHWTTNWERNIGSWKFFMQPIQVVMGNVCYFLAGSCHRRSIDLLQEILLCLQHPFNIHTHCLSRDARPSRAAVFSLFTFSSGENTHRFSLCVGF